MRAWKSRSNGPALPNRPSIQYILARSQVTTPPNSVPSNSVSTVAARCRPLGEHRELTGHACPQPGFGPAFLGRRFVDAQALLGWQLLHEFAVGWLQSGGCLVLQFDSPPRRAGLVENLFEKQCHAAFALPEAAHQQGCEGDQAATGLTRRNARWQFGAGGLLAIGTAQTMTLVLGDKWLDLGNSQT